MIATRNDNGTEVTKGDRVLDVEGNQWTFDHIVSAPQAIGNAGGPFAGRIAVTNTQGVQWQPYAFEVGIIIEVP